MGITQIGIEGEQKLFKFLKERGIDFFQADAIGLNNGKYEIYEVKHQERYTPPPFEGHGLPRWQVESRIKFQKITNIKCLFVVFEKGTNDVFYQYLDLLEASRYFDTYGTNPRRIYPLTNFLKN